ncbi:hypothetical protein ACF08B_39755 [Streptomyces sp. NPDC015139]|uniref:hypothetical protein n=1 Tax=Streptomyces sp. NPDC015139 TaxID=3364942 RepID=UPI0037035E17
MSTIPPTTSLVELAARKQLPYHQFTDHATVRWIEENRPYLIDGAPSKVRVASRGLLTRAAIPAAWLAEPRLRDSLHGVRHMMRTAALAALLAETTGLDEPDTAVLVIAAATHDCRRLHDKDDRGHGARAAQWLTMNAEVVWEHFRVEATEPAIAQAAASIRLHDVPYLHFTAEDEADYASARVISDLVKAADALDRYRLPKLSWWPDSQFLRVEAVDQLRAAAFDLVLWSEAGHLAGLDSADAVLKAFERRELID